MNVISGIFHHKEEEKPVSTPATPVVAPAVVSAAPVAAPKAATTPAAPQETTAQKIQSFFTNFGKDIEATVNGIVNVAVEEQTPVLSLLPANLQPGVAQLINYAAAQVAAVDAKYAAIGASNVPFAQKVAEAVATGGIGALAIAAQAGVSVTGTLNNVFSASAIIASSLNLSTITQAPVVPPAAPAA